MDESGEFEAGAGTVTVEVGGMVVADDLDRAKWRGNPNAEIRRTKVGGGGSLEGGNEGAVAVVEDETVAEEGIAGGEWPAGVVVAGDDADGDG